MQKLKLHILNKMIQKKLTSAEVNFMLFISQYQDEDGSVTGVYYKSTSASMGISYQKFYDLKKSLIKKEIIEATKEAYSDWDVIIIDNDFTNKDYSGGYINTSQAIFYDKKFLNLKAGEKLLAMQFLKITQAGERSFKIRTENFIPKYHKMFGVTRRIFKKYLTNLKDFFSIGIKEGLYYITPLKKVAVKEKNKEVINYNKHSFITALRRRRIKFNATSFAETFNLLRQYASKGINMAHLDLALAKSIILKNRHLRNTKKWDRQLQPSLIHMLLKEMIA